MVLVIYLLLIILVEHLGKRLRQQVLQVQQEKVIFVTQLVAAFTATLPAGTLGDEISFIDYAGTFDTNNLTIAPNGAEKIQGSAASLTVSVERAGLTLVYTDGTQGWLLKDK
jgi:hypothetical protein